MLNDFDSDTLPIDETHTYDTSKAQEFSPSTWPHIIATGTEILLACLLKSSSTGGWMKVNEDIAIMMLPLNSLMRFYWANEMALEGHHSSNRTTKP